MKRLRALLFLSFLSCTVLSQSPARTIHPHTVLHSTGLADVHWTSGFWADRFAIVRDSMIPGLWRTYTDPH
jgi:hypothetical protein